MDLERISLFFLRSELPLQGISMESALVCLSSLQGIVPHSKSQLTLLNKGTATTLWEQSSVEKQPGTVLTSGLQPERRNEEGRKARDRSIKWATISASTVVQAKLGGRPCPDLTDH